jgi:hypothetical protein
MRSRRDTAVVGTLACAAAVLASCSGSAFPPSSGSVTVTWRSTTTGSQTSGDRGPYGGTVAGIPVGGHWTSPDQGLTPPNDTSRITLSRWTGTLDGKSFTVAVSFDFGSITSGSTASIKLSDAVFDIRGTYGGQPVTGTAGPPTSVNAQTIGFRGTVAGHHVTGTVTDVSHHGRTGTAKADFTVSG